MITERVLLNFKVPHKFERTLKKKLKLSQNWHLV